MKAAALATAIGASALSPSVGNDERISPHDTSHVTHVEPAKPTQKTPLEMPHKAPEVHKAASGINIDVISQIESGNDPDAVNDTTGATGMCQLMPDTWKEETKKMFGEELPVEKMTDGDLNKKVASHYFNITIPKFLKHYKLPITYETVLASYNYGVGNVIKLYKSHKDTWQNNLPDETKNYISAYKNLANIQ